MIVPDPIVRRRFYLIDDKVWRRVETRLDIRGAENIQGIYGYH